MSHEPTTSPWQTVLALIQRFEDALAVIWLFERRDAELLANGQSLTGLVDGFPSERPVAALLANRMRELEGGDGGDWEHTHFYGPSRGTLAPTEDEVRAFVERCAEAGVRLHYADGTDTIPVG